MNAPEKKRRKATKILKRHLTLFAIVCSSMLALSFLVLICERGEVGATINNYPDAVWFVFGSASTIGWGDMVATTDSGKLFTFIAYMFSRIVVIAMLLSSFKNFFGKGGIDEMTVEDRLIVIENELKQQRSSISGLAKDVHITVKDHNQKKSKHSRYVANSVCSLKDFMASDAARGAEVVANFSEKYLIDNFPDDYQIIQALCRDNRIYSLKYTGGVM